ARRVVTSFLVDPRPRAAAFAPDGRRAYVTAEIGGSIAAVDVAKHEVVATRALPAPAKPVGIAVSPDGARLYVADGAADLVHVLDASDFTEHARVPVGKRPWNLALAPDAAMLYVANGRSNDVSVVDTATLRVVRTIPVGAGPWGVAIGR